MSFIDALTPPARRAYARSLRTRYENGATLEELRAELKLATLTVRGLLVEAGATIRPPGTLVTDKQAATFVKLYKAGETIQQVSERVGYSFGTVRRYLLLAGVELRPRGIPADRQATTKRAK